MNRAFPGTMLLLMSLGLSGCTIIDDGGDCPEPKEYHVASDVYAAVENEGSKPTDWFPASQAPDLLVDVDRDEDRVTLTYTRDGKTVVETYRIAATEVW